MRALRQLFVIARTTALEGLQQPVYLLLSLTAAVLTLLGPLVQLFSFGEEGRLARDSGLAFMLVFGLFIVGLTSGFTLAEELRRGTAAATLAKPVGRAVFLLGKFLGVMASTLLFCFTMTLATMLAERSAEHFVETPEFVGAIVDRYSGLGAIAAAALSLGVAALLNYRHRIRFGLAASVGLAVSQLATILVCSFVTRTGDWSLSFAPQLNPRLPAAAFLVFLLLVLQCALATALSTRLRTGPTTAICGLVLFAGFLLDLAAGLPAPVRALLAFIPNVQNFWRADALGNGGSLPAPYLAQAALHALVLCTIYLGLGHAALRSRDIG